MPSIRQKVIQILSEREGDIRTLSKELHIKEKELYGHLPHIAKSLTHLGKKLEIIPAICKSCGFVFSDRNRFTKPGKCPKCKDEHIEAPCYRIVTK